MELIPAIDLKDGHCVRLKQGRMDDDTVFSEDPVAVADHWVKQGARRLHLVDLNGAFAGEPVNGEIVNAIARAHPGLPIQIGGGIRSAETIQAYLDAGVQWVIIGTKAVKEPQFVRDMCKQFPGHVIVGLDAKDGKVATDGWAEVTDIDVVDLARALTTDPNNRVPHLAFQPDELSDMPVLTMDEMKGSVVIIDKLQVRTAEADVVRSTI